MKTLNKLIITLLFLVIGVSSFSQFFKSEHDNVLIFQEEEILTNNFNPEEYIGQRHFKYINDRFIVITSPKDYFPKNYKSISVYENYNYKNTYSFDYKINTREFAHYKDEIIIPITDIDDSWNVLCKLNMATEEISYISLPENLRYLDYGDYDLDDFTFDETTHKLYIFVRSDAVDQKYVIPYDLKTGEFLEKIPHDFYQNSFTLNSYHYFYNKSWNFYSIKIDEPDAKPKKISLPAIELGFPVKISDSEMMCYSFKKTNEIVYRSINDHSMYVVLKDGELIIDKENTYLNLFNSIRHKRDKNVFSFNYSEIDGYKNSVTLNSEIKECYKNKGGATIIRPGYFLLYTAENNDKPQNSVQPTTDSGPSFYEEFEKRVLLFFNSGNSKFIFNTPESWYGKCLEFEKCNREKEYGYFECKDLKEGLQSLGLDSKLSECEFLLNLLTGSRKEYLKIEMGIENYENLKNELIAIKSTIIRVKAQF